MLVCTAIEISSTKENTDRFLGLQAQRVAFSNIQIETTHGPAVSEKQKIGRFLPILLTKAEMGECFGEIFFLSCAIPYVHVFKMG